MIRVRYAADEAVTPALPRPSIERTTDPRVLTSEYEKNGKEMANKVDQFLRPAFAQRWTAARGPLFEILAVETRAGCNYSCTFCPVARSVDPRPPGEMSSALLSSLAAQLGTLAYRGMVSLFGNNEPLLDDRLVPIVGLFRSEAPAANLRVLTNGTKVSHDLVRQLFAQGLSTLIINNYTNGERIIAPVQALLDDAAEFADVDIRINIRRRDEILTTRAGTAPNKPVKTALGHGFCALPFTDLHVAYTGEVNVCCFDAHGVTTMGSVTNESLTDIWYGDKLQGYRDQLLMSDRSGLVPCSKCDFDGFRDPLAGSGGSLVRGDLGTSSQVHLRLK